MDPLFLSSPFGALTLLPEDVQDGYISLIFDAPKSIQDLIFSPRMGAYVRGLIKAYQVQSEKTPALALLIVNASLGKISLSQIAASVSVELGTGRDIATRIARDIEKDLFVPIMLEYNAYLQQKKSTSSTAAVLPNVAHPTGVRNVLDLKTQPKPPAPPTIPRKQ